mmetsp:Transcript_4847/g.14100  ORF Transcript_4847/g.14100 Transcript_4847/m.14100 type:complete len:272 (-) Transcript_4847:1456-2271(-)
MDLNHPGARVAFAPGGSARNNEWQHPSGNCSKPPSILDASDSHVTLRRHLLAIQRQSQHRRHAILAARCARCVGRVKAVEAVVAADAFGEAPQQACGILRLRSQLSAKRPLRDDGFDFHAAEETRTCLLPASDLVTRAQQVVGNTLCHDRVPLVLGVFLDDATHPTRRCEQLATRAALDQDQVCVDTAEGLRIATDVLQVGVAEGHEPKERALAPNDVRHGHLVAMVVGLPAGLDIAAEPKFLRVHGVDALGPRHVFVHLGQRREEVEAEG